MQLIYKKQTLLWRATQKTYSVANITKKLHIHYNLHTGYKHNFYNDIRENFDELFDQYHLPLLKYIDHPALIQ